MNDYCSYTMPELGIEKVTTYGLCNSCLNKREKYFLSVVAKCSFLKKDLYFD